MIVSSFKVHCENYVPVAVIIHIIPSPAEPRRLRGYYLGREEMVVAYIPMIASSVQVYCDGCAFHCDNSQFPRTCRIMYQTVRGYIHIMTGVAGKS
jgi:hypothetical protein